MDYVVIFHLSGVGKWGPASAGKEKAGMVHSVSRWMQDVQVKLWDPLRTRTIPERLKGVFTTRRYTNPRLPVTCAPTSVAKHWCLVSGKVTAGLVQSNDSLPLGLWLMSLAAWLPRDSDELWPSVPLSEVWSYLYHYFNCCCAILYVTCLIRVSAHTACVHLVTMSKVYRRSSSRDTMMPSQYHWIRYLLYLQSEWLWCSVEHARLCCSRQVLN